MKYLMIVAALLMASTSFAISEKQTESRTKKAKQEFKQLIASNPNLGEMEDKFVVKGGLSNVPGVGIFSLRYVCQNGSNIQTTKPVNYCIQWAVDFKNEDGDKWSQSYDSHHAALMAEDDRFATSDAYCVQKSAPKIVSHPINYQAKGCVLWAVDFEDEDGDEWTKTYTSKIKAISAEKSKDADSDAYCAQKGMVNKTAPTSINLKVYRKRFAGENISLDKDDDDLFLGRWKYTVPSCGEVDLPPVYAN